MPGTFTNYFRTILLCLLTAVFMKVYYPDAICQLYGSGTSLTKIAWVDGHGEKPLSTYMTHIVEVLEIIGYKPCLDLKTHIENKMVIRANSNYKIVTGEEAKSSAWTVMWIHEYSLIKPVYMESIMRATPAQTVNHVPGSGYYTSKVSLATSSLSRGVPEAFSLPGEKEKFLNFAKDHEDYLWVQKDNSHRNIKITNFNELDLTRTNSFVQRFIENPLLIDGRKFDIGVYTVVTSLKPLKVYLYTGDVIIRFCPHAYEPFDASDVDKYVVGDDYTPIWEIESLKEFFTIHKMGWRQTLDTYLIQKNMNPMIIWEQIGTIIAEVFQSKQLDMLSQSEFLNIPTKYFELSRFDFIVDDSLNVFLMEANMSPNLSSEHFAENKQLYKQVIFNVLSLVGLINPVPSKTIEKKELNSEVYEVESFISDRDISVHLDQCLDSTCENCSLEICKLCQKCMSERVSKMLKTTFSEHNARKQMMLVQFDYQNKKPSTADDFLLWSWLEAKCKEDPSWCH